MTEGEEEYEMAPQKRSVTFSFHLILSSWKQLASNLCIPAVGILQDRDSDKVVEALRRKKSNSQLYGNPNVKIALYKLPAGCLVGTFMPFALCAGPAAWSVPGGRGEGTSVLLDCSVCRSVPFSPQKLDKE